MPFDARVVQDRYSSVVALGSLPAFEIVFQTFCLGLWQDTSLLLKAHAVPQEPDGTPLNEAKSLCDLTVIFLFYWKDYHFTESPPFLTLWPGQVSEERRGRRKSGRAALRVLSGPTISELTYAAQINWTFEFPYLSAFETALWWFCEGQKYSYFLDIWMDVVLESYCNEAASTQGCK